MSSKGFKGLEPGSELAVPAHRDLGTPELTYTYVDAVGVPLFAVARFATTNADGEADKDFRQGHPSTSGAGWAWNLRGVEPVLYRLDELSEHLAEGRAGPVYITEGEKDCDRLRAHLADNKLAGVATTVPMGSHKWKPAYTETLTGCRHVVILVDNDEAGHRGGRAAAAELGPHVDRVQVLRPALDHKGADVSDHLDAGLDLDELIPLEDPIDATPAELAEGELFMDLRAFIALEHVPPPPLWGTEDHALLVEGGLALFAGRPHVGKTTWIVDLIFHLAAGLPYPPRDPHNDRAPEPFPVARPLRIGLIENEGPLELFRDKVRRKSESFPHPIEDAGGYIGIQTWRWGAFSFADNDAFLRIAAEVEEKRLDLVVGDPLGMLGTEGVGAPDETGRFVARLRSLGLGTSRAFLLIHHFRQRREKEDDELSALSGAWSQHLDSLFTLANTGQENEARLAFPKLRWARAELPKPIILGRVYARAGFEAQGLEDDVGLLEPKLAEAMRELRSGGGGYRGWETSRNLAAKIGRGKMEVPKVLENAPHLFVMVTGQEARELGAKTKSTKLWGLKEWTDEPLELVPDTDAGDEPEPDSLDWR